jgi:hypothetical protein
VEQSRVEWSPAITGAFGAVAVAIVLTLFGAAFEQGGLRVLAGVWMVMTPLVALFIGGAIAAWMAGRPDTYATGIMVWCIALVAGTLLVSAQSASGREPAANAAWLALAGLAAILGFIGALVGSAVGASSKSALVESTLSRSDHPSAGVGHAAETRTVGRPQPSADEAEQPQVRH